MRRAFLAAAASSLAACASTSSTLTPAQQAESQRWAAAVSAKIRSRIYYPRDPASPQPLTSGTVHVRFSVASSGAIYTPQVMQGSGYPIFDSAALMIVLSASPLPPPPAFLLNADGALSLRQRISFVPPAASPPI